MAPSPSRDDVIRLRVHVHPGAKVANVGGSRDGALSVHVRARAVEGAATDETLALLATALGVRRRDVRLVRGAHSRDKLVEVTGDADELERRVTALRTAGGPGS